MPHAGRKQQSTDRANLNKLDQEEYLLVIKGFNIDRQEFRIKIKRT